MRHLALASSVLFLAGLTGASAASPKDPTGTWLTGDGRAKIRIDRCGPGQSHVCGKVVWLKLPNTDAGAPRTDIKNPDPKKRSRPVMGLTLLDGLKPDEDKFSGEIYNAEEGKMYKVSLERESEAELSISGCLLGVLCGSQTWTRVPDVNKQAAMAANEPQGAAPAAKPAKSEAKSETKGETKGEPTRTGSTKAAAPSQQKPAPAAPAAQKAAPKPAPAEDLPED